MKKKFKNKIKIEKKMIIKIFSNQKIIKKILIKFPGLLQKDQLAKFKI
jgi:hypothetical protein